MKINLTESLNENKIFYHLENDKEQLMMSFNSPEECFNEAAKLYAFDDCSEVVVEKIIANGEEVHYDGWMPNNEFIFKNNKDEIVFDQSFPQWEH